VVRADSNAKAAAVWLSLAILAAGFSEARAQEPADQERAEARLEELSREIEALKRRLESARSDFKSEQKRLQEVDLAIQGAGLRARELEQEIETHRGQLAALQARRADYLASLGDRMGQLGEQLRSSYRLGGQSRLKLVLNQDDPLLLGRMLAYYEYLNRAQLVRISGLRETLATLDDIQASVDLELQRLEGVRRTQEGVLDELGRQREERRILLTSLSEQVDSEESRLRELERNRRDLQALVDRLSDALADIPADLGTRRGLASLKGRLPMPLDGPVRHAFGQRRAGGMNWQGWLIAADTGSEARAVAYGRVAFADWLRGYGLLIIIDHGEGYLSLYGQNESLLAEAGSWVRPGQAIGVVGSNPGGSQGLYFELRKNGKAVDPAVWIDRR
jgi:septal ring factor EnvC (AmiA/AmiB activator)